ncbi:tripartite tricarboxylate transporter permease [Pseudooceanicola nanhaiensis]|uniref:tripartite tricarboxylate transporter permease n=1 Tax=Pseudooceanicola nanhaiensis TaxID=375761 RepID=UPI001CD5A159|nr:tripartite tricarboxylate transporter permease [Pseudooceanicola nanhaiensis]MCA0919917.1 tripartite tricarboxylate transporter permease [Pseudooceanicola nanhaiensis]
MIDLSAFSAALSLLGSDPLAWLVVIPGLFIGLVFGAIPGLSISIAMAVFLPATLYMDFLPAILFLTAIFTGGGFGGAVPAILMNIPGTSSAVATAFDGYPMSKKGQHGEALGAGLVASAVGTLFGYILLMFIVSPVATWVLMLGPTEMLIVAIWGLLLIAVLNDSSIAKGLAAGILGILISTIGYSDTGLMRGTFGSMYLLDGIPAIPALIGLFAASELINMAGRDYLIADREMRKMKLKPILKGAGDTMRGWPQVLRGSAIGTLIGIIPGVGASVANLASYAATKRLSKEPETFGKGNREGVVASEAANSSSEGGGMVTLLALGLPGGAGTAILLGAFAMHDVTGGPRFISENTDIVYALILGNIAQAILLLGVGLVFVFLASSIVKIRLSYLIPYVLSVSMMGTYAITGSIVGPLTVAGAGALGWIMRRYGYPVTATVVGLLIGPMAEGELTRSWQISGGDPAFILTRPITMVMLVLLILMLLAVLVGKRMSRQTAPVIAE